METTRGGTIQFEMPQQQLLEEQEQLGITPAIDRLPENQRTALILNKYEELSYKEYRSHRGLLSLPWNRFFSVRKIILRKYSTRNKRHCHEKDK